MTTNQPSLKDVSRPTETSAEPTAGDTSARSEPDSVRFSADFPDDVDAAAAQAARAVLQGAPPTDRVYALVSGGHDSLTAMHIVYQSSLPLDGIIHIRTGIGVPETREFVQARADELALEYHEVGAKHDGPGYHSEHRRVHEEYVELIKQYGFPGPGAHKWMYVNLKEKPLQRFLSGFDEDVLLVSGVSKHESDNRMENVEDDGIQTYLGCPTISPLVEFTGMDVRDYRRGLDLPMNPVVEKLEMSGECLCLAGDTLIATERGWRPIGGIDVGDRVYSLQDGSTQLTEVVETHVQPQDEMLEIKPYYRPSIAVTPNHPFYARMTGYDHPTGGSYKKYVHDPLWVEAGEIARIVQANRGTGPHVDQNFRLATPFRTREQPVDLTDDELRLLGYFVAEGAYQWRPSRTSESRGVAFCLSRESRALAENIQEAFEGCFPDLSMEPKPKEDPRDGREYWMLRTGHPTVSAFMEEWSIGHTSRELQLDQRLMTATVDRQQTLLDAMWHGDGTEYVVDRRGHADEQVSAYGTSSKRLALQVQELLLRQGEVYGINQSGNDSYLVRQTKGDAKSGNIEENILWTRVQSVANAEQQKRYNLTVRGEPNYTTEAGLVHNCGAFTGRGELEMLKLFYPDVYHHIKCLEAAVSAATVLEDGPDEEYKRWGHNRLQEREQAVLDDGDQMLLCRDCEWQGKCDQ